MSESRPEPSYTLALENDEVVLRSKDGNEIKIPDFTYAVLRHDKRLTVMFAEEMKTREFVGVVPNKSSPVGCSEIVYVCSPLELYMLRRSKLRESFVFPTSVAAFRQKYLASFHSYKGPREHVANAIIPAEHQDIVMLITFDVGVIEIAAEPDLIKIIKRIVDDAIQSVQEKRPLRYDIPLDFVLSDE